MNVINGRTLDEIYPELCGRISKEEFTVSPRGMVTRDIGATTLVVSEPWRRVITNRHRKINPYFMIAEFLWILTRDKRASSVGFYNSKMYNYSDDGRNLYGAYGPRLMYQLPAIINKIRLDPNTRQAVATIFMPKDQIVITKDFPCNIMLHFLPRNGTLDLIVYVRSQDVLLGLPYDFYHWSVLLEMVAHEVGMSVGAYTHICGSMHGYEENLEALSIISHSKPADILEFEQPAPQRLPDTYRPISTLEYEIRRNQIDEELFKSISRQIDSLQEDDFVRDHLGTLLYYRVRRNKDFSEPNPIRVTGHFQPLLEHIGWS